LDQDPADPFTILTYGVDGASLANKHTTFQVIEQCTEGISFEFQMV